MLLYNQEIQIVQMIKIYITNLEFLNNYIPKLREEYIRLTEEYIELFNIDESNFNSSKLLYDTSIKENNTL